MVADIPLEFKPGDLEHLLMEPNSVAVVSDAIQVFVVSGANSRPVPFATWDVQGDIGIFEEPGM